ncbi:hypothetical protein FACS189411_10840 [Bacteroidia bacterium]|nr:hypothetical protein FACS189411_10840 [Bacteroidia bacterium]
MYKLNNFLIIGITGGVGSAFCDLCANNIDANIVGTYCHDIEKAKQIQENSPKIKLYKIDLGQKNHLKLDFLECECLAFFAGSPYFSDTLFSANGEDLITQINLHTTAFLAMVFDLVKRNSNLKKIIVLGSYYPEKINSIYHLSKQLTERAIELIIPSLEEKEISLSMVYSGWINTKMYNQYRKTHPCSIQTARNPLEIAEICYKEINNNKPLNIIRL